MITISAQAYTVAQLAQSGYSVERLVDAQLSPEQARDVVFLATGVNIHAGRMQWAMDEYRKRQAETGDARVETVEQTASDFQRDPLGEWHARMTGKECARTTELYRLMRQKAH